jgi:hypothetical protein
LAVRFARAIPELALRPELLSTAIWELGNDI